MGLNTAYRAALGAALVALLAGGWVFLYTHSHAIRADDENAVLALLKDVKQADSEWTANVLRSHTDINLNYDALTQPLRPFSEALATLRERVRAFRTNELDQAVTELAQALDAKAARIESFKAQNSLLKNSLRYVPTAHRDIAARMRAERDAGLSVDIAARREATRAFDELERSVAAAKRPEAGADLSGRIEQALVAVRSKVKAATGDGGNRSAAGLMNLEGNVAMLVDEVLRYSSIPDRDAAEGIRSDIAHLRAALPTRSVAAREAVDNLLAHLETLMRLRTRQIDLLRDISAVPVGARVDALAEGVGRRFDAELAGQNQYQRYLLAYSALALLLVAGGTGFILYRNATERRRLAALVDQQTLALKENEVHLVHAQRMAAVGEMVAGVAHEVNTPLAAVKSSLQSSRELLVDIGRHFDQAGEFVEMVVQRGGGDNAERAARKAQLSEKYKTLAALRREIAEFDSLRTIDQLMEDGVHSVEHIAGVVVNMLNFSRLDRTKIAAGRIEDGLDATLSIARHLLRSVTVHRHYGNTLPVSCDMAQINQVVLNLVKNAAQAVPQTGGEIHISTSMAGSSEVRIDVRDNGSGIAPDDLPRIWKPFFTTKGEGVGTGLGLSTCKKIVAAHGGRIGVESHPGRGTTFTVILPLAPPPTLYREHGQLPSRQLMPA